MVMTRCEERERLRELAMNTLSQIISVTQKLLEANRSNERNTVAHLDKELEHLIGEKERAFGALNQHSKDHGC
jgi:hypothetical protein